MAIAKEQIRQIIADNNFINVGDVYDYPREGFKDILQELMEVEMDVALGYKKILGMLNDLKNRGIKDVLFFCVDGLQFFLKRNPNSISKCQNPTLCHSYAA